MKGNKGLWFLAEEDAERLRRMARRSRNPHVAAVLLLASQTLHDFSLDAIRGSVSNDVLIRLESLERLFKLYGLPAGLISKYRRAALKLSLPSLLEGVPSMGEPLGMPI
ncbi:MAG: hypothetical protein F7C81_02405 [Desulfurococcales archaeon]|nr:hypothetical protein [Desulfurococcales archaeon]